MRSLPPRLVTALLCGAGILSACGPALKQSEDFTPLRVRQVVFDDECGLQRYFDQDPGNYEQRGDFNVGAEGHRTAGHATYRLIPGAQTRTFVGLVQRLYRRVPPLPSDEPLRVTVQYQESKGRRVLPIGAETVIDQQDESIELPYHPCIGAFFFAAEQYAMRGGWGQTCEAGDTCSAVPSSEEAVTTPQRPVETEDDQHQHEKPPAVP